MTADGTIAVLLKGYPRLSETFIAQEIRELERASFSLRLYAMRRPTDSKTHPVHHEIVAPVVYLPEYLHWEPWRVLRGIWSVRGRPGFRTALATCWRRFKRRPGRDAIRRLGQGCVMAAELPADVRWLHVHFIHTPASVTRHAAEITGIGWSCSAHAKDIWTSADADLSDKLAHMAWSVTCTGAGHGRLAALGAPGRVRLVYHGLDLQRFPAPPRAVVSTRDGHSASDPVRLLSVGRAVPKKGFDVLLQALARLPADLAWRWTHIGGGDQRPQLMRTADRLGLASRIVWRGGEDQPSVLAAYREADVFILPSRIGRDGDQDGLPNVLMEAQSQTLACISTRVGAISELIIDGETGVLLPPDDPESLATAITRLSRNPELRQRMGAAGAERVRGEFDHRATIPQLCGLLSHSLGGSPAGPTARTEATPARQRIEA